MLSSWALKQATFQINLAPDSNGTPIPPEITSFRFSYLATSNDIGIYNSSGQDSISTLDEAFGGTGVDVWLSSLPETEVGDIVTVSLTVSMNSGPSCTASGSLEVRD